MNIRFPKGLLRFRSSPLNLIPEIRVHLALKLSPSSLQISVVVDAGYPAFPATFFRNDPCWNRPCVNSHASTEAVGHSRQHFQGLADQTNLLSLLAGAICLLASFQVIMLAKPVWSAHIFAAALLHMHICCEGLLPPQRKLFFATAIKSVYFNRFPFLTHRVNTLSISALSDNSPQHLYFISLFVKYFIALSSIIKSESQCKARRPSLVVIPLLSFHLAEVFLHCYYIQAPIYFTSS